VQIHNWAHDLMDKSVPSIEFVAPAKSFVVVNGEKRNLDLLKVPAMSARQLQMLSYGGADGTTSGSASTGSMLQEIPHDYLMKRLGGARSMCAAASLSEWRLAAGAQPPSTRHFSLDP
jgi:2-methylaconitate cis-trans-isomerase PrpF